MPKKSVRHDVAEALNQLKEARGRLQEQIGGVLSERYAGPASESEIAQLEAALGRPLPPSYRSFLLLQNGFPEIDGETDVLSAAAVQSLAFGPAKALLEGLASTLGKSSIERCLIFGRSENPISLLLFDPAEVNESGEWRVLEYDEQEDLHGIHGSFLEFLVATTADTREAAEEASEGQDLLDMDF